MSGNSPAIITAKIVIASELLEMVVLQDARKRNKIAEMRVPECAIPTQNTKFTRYEPHIVGWVILATPRPVAIWYPQEKAPTRTPSPAIAKQSQ